MFLNLLGEAPCPVIIVCPGWPFPQFGVPHSTQLFLSAIASQEFQNSGGGFSGHEISHELSTLDRELSLGFYSLIIVAEGSQSVPMLEGCIHYNIHVF